MQNWLEPSYMPCNVTDLNNNNPEIFKTDIIFFFIGDNKKHPRIRKAMLNVLSPNKISPNSSMKPVRKCFNKIHFKSLRQLDLPSSLTIRDLFYGVIPSKLVSSYTHIIWMDASVSPLHNNWLSKLYHTLHSEPFWVLGAMTMSQRFDHFDRSHYHMHMNAIYRIGNACFNQFLNRVKNEYKSTMPDLAIHLYRTDYANFREAQHTQHLFRYSQLFTALDIPMTVKPGVNSSDWPETYFLIQDKHWTYGGKKMIFSKDHNLVIEEDLDDGDEEFKEVPVIKNEIKEKSEKKPNNNNNNNDNNQNNQNNHEAQKQNAEPNNEPNFNLNLNPNNNNNPNEKPQ